MENYCLLVGSLVYKMVKVHNGQHPQAIDTHEATGHYMV